MLRATRFREFAREHGRGWLLAALATAAFGVSAAVVARVALDAKRHTLRISSGNTEGVWYPTLLGLARDTPDGRLRLVPVVTNGSLEMVEGLEDGTLDFAFVQGGYDVARFPDLRQVAGMSESEILDDFSYLTTEDIHACLAFAAERERRMLVASP